MRVIALSVALLAWLPSTASAQQLLTVAERSDFKATSKHAEVVEYCERLAKLSPLVRLAELGVTNEKRKLPLVIHVDPMQILSLNKTCRYCPHCDLLIAHQNDVEHFLASYFIEQKPEVVGNDYLVLGTLEKPTWKRGTQQPMTLQEMLEALHDFKEVVTFKVTRGWVRDETKLSAKK